MRPTKPETGKPERTDLAAQYPERVKTMQAAALHMRNEIRDGSQMLSGQ